MGTSLALYLILILVVAPVASWRSAAGGAILRHSRLHLYLAGMATSWFLALLGAAVLWWEGRLGPEEVGLRGLPALRCLFLTTATLATLLAGTLLISLLRRVTGRPESPELVHLVPRDRRDKRLFAAMAVTAGLTEEFVFRGLAITALVGLPLFSGAGGPWLATLIVSLSFGLGHGYQEGIGMARAGLLGLVLAVPFLASGSLLPGMIAHTAADLSLLARPGRRLVERAGAERALEPSHGAETG